MASESWKSLFISLVVLVVGTSLLTFMYCSVEENVVYGPLRTCNGIRISLDPEKACLWKCRIPFSEVKTLPAYATNDTLRYFVLFVGSGRSGSSFTGALLDAHPNALLAHEYFLARRMAVTPHLFPNKSSLFSQLYTNQLRKMDRDRLGKGEQKGYSIFINNSYAGRYRDTISIVGEKSAAMTLYVFMNDEERFEEVLHRIRFLTGVLIKFIHVVRNPLDTIATAYTYHVGGADLRSKMAANPNFTMPTEERILDCTIEHHRMEVEGVVKMEQSGKYDIFRLYTEDMILHPHREIRRLCAFLELQCDDDYLETCAASLFASPSLSRTHIQWTPEQIHRIISLIETTPYLATRYVDEL